MIGIVSYGAYVPIKRLSRATIAAAWGSGPRSGEKAVANFDEDSITMAVAACQDLLVTNKREQIDGLYLASTTLPYVDKQAAALVAEAIDLPRRATTMDFGGSLRAGTAAFISALAAVKSGMAHNILVSAADCRLATPKSDIEQLMGCGAAAFEIGDSDVLAEVVSWNSHYDEFVDTWRKTGERFLKSGEDRYIVTEGYMRNVRESIKETMQALHISATDVKKLVMYTPDDRSHAEVARSLGFDTKTQLQDALSDKVGISGSASMFLTLVGALEGAKAGDLILAVSWGDGCDTLVLRVTENIGKFKPRRGLAGHLNSKIPLKSYQDYLVFRNIVETEPARRTPPTSSLPARWRSRSSLVSLHGCKCHKCGTVQFPVQRVCHICRTKDDFEEVRLSDLRGKVFTFTKDFIAPSPDLPQVMTVLELENGCRFFCQMTDRDPDAVSLGMEVELTFRKLFEHDSYINYYWKCKPIR